MCISSPGHNKKNPSLYHSLYADGRMGWTDGMDGGTDGRDERRDGRRDGRTDRWMDGRIDGWRDIPIDDIKLSNNDFSYSFKFYYLLKEDHSYTHCSYSHKYH